MQKRHTILILSFLLSLSLQAGESYKAPRIKMNAPGYKDVVAKPSSDWDSDYRVEETVTPERGVASDKAPVEAKKAERNPGSVEPTTPRPAPWLYDRK